MTTFCYCRLCDAISCDFQSLVFNNFLSCCLLDSPGLREKSWAVVFTFSMFVNSLIVEQATSNGHNRFYLKNLAKTIFAPHILNSIWKLLYIPANDSLCNYLQNDAWNTRKFHNVSYSNAQDLGSSYQCPQKFLS